MRTPKKRRPPNRKRRPADGDFPPLDDIDFGLDSEAWTQSLVIDFWRSATFRQHTRATLQEYDLVMKKCREENTKFKLDYLLIEILPTYNYTHLLPQRRL